MSSRQAANADSVEGKEGKEKMSEGLKEGKEPDPSRSVSVMSTLSYRKRSNLKDSIGGMGDDSSLFSTLKEQPDGPDHALLRKAKGKPGAEVPDDRRKSQASQDDMDDRGSVISMAYSEAASHARKGLDRRWTASSTRGGSPDKDSVVSLLAPSRLSVARRSAVFAEDDDDAKSVISSVSRSSPRSLQRSTSWKEDRRSGSRMSLARSCGLSEFGVCMDDDEDNDDTRSLAFTEGGTSSFSPRAAHSRSYSTPARPRSSEGSVGPDVSDTKPVTHRNYLDPDLETAINEVLSFKPIKFKRSKLEDSDNEDDDDKPGEGEGEGSAVMSGGAGEDARRGGSRLKADDEGLGRSTTTSSLSRAQGPARRPRLSDEEEDAAAVRPGKKESKKSQKKVDSLVMKYLYKPDSD
ncbi:hypothetical protein CRUP_029495 [Coryphaenoides rupestris]|nr:hypothetical protein CRUP_029495 [Coryphaenoides rupestris]